MASANRTDAAVLVSVARELEHRSSKSAERLRADVQRWLVEARTDHAVGESGTGAARELKVCRIAGDARSHLHSQAPIAAGVSGRKEKAPAVSDRQDQPVGKSDEAISVCGLAVRLEFGTHRAARLLLRPARTVVITEDAVAVETGGLFEKIALSSLENLSVETGLFFSAIVLRCRGKSIRIPWLRKADASAIEATIRVLKYYKDVAEALDAFDQMQRDDAYLNRRRVDEWLAGCGDLQQLSKVDLSLAPLRTDHPILSGAARLVGVITGLDAIVAARNTQFTEKERRRYQSFFDRIEVNPLTDRQVEAVVSDEDNTLVVAGAGTGKTSTVVAKIGYLVERGIAREDQILALAFGREAAREMRDRVKQRTGHSVEIRTFHSLALEVVRQVEQVRPQVAGLAFDETSYNRWVAEELDNIMADPAIRDRFVKFAVYHRYPARYWEEFTCAADYLEYVRGQEPRTLRQELVRSFEEQMIADWLTLHGVAYEYERVYQEAATGDVNRREYRPDFYLPEYRVYLEHFGIDREGRTAPHISAPMYRRQMEWKRQLHRQHGTTLLETYSYERMEGRLHASLREKITRLKGEAPTLLPDADLRELVGRPHVREPLVKLMARFITAFKGNQWSMGEVRATAASSAMGARANAFLDLFELVYEAYEQHLRQRREIDFADMINRATWYVEQGRYELGFTRVIVDEFQDISRGRQRFLKTILAKQGDVRFYGVGDDWQSIYGFTGSDVSIMTRFSDVFGYVRRVDLDVSFRCNDKILDASARFIQYNPNQLKKKMRTVRSHAGPAIHIEGSAGAGIEELLRSAVRLGPKGKVKSILVLGRFNHLEPKELVAVAKRLGVKAEFMSIHKAKGQEADAVVLLDLAHGRHGFPALLEDDPLLMLVLPETGEFPHAEERRILYVGLTRARETVVLQVPERSPSPFARELSEAAYRKEVLGTGWAPEACCGNCGGALIRTRKNTTGFPWACEFHPHCDGGAPMCPECRGGAFLDLGGSYRCASPDCGYAEAKCMMCGGRTFEYDTEKGRVRRCRDKACGYAVRLYGVPRFESTSHRSRRPMTLPKHEGSPGNSGRRWTRGAVLDALERYSAENGDLPTRKDAKQKIDYMPSDPRVIMRALGIDGWREAMAAVAVELGLRDSRYFPATALQSEPAGRSDC